MKRPSSPLPHAHSSALPLIHPHLHARIEADGGRGTVRQLADWLAQEHPQVRGFTASNLRHVPGQSRTRNTGARTGLVPPHDHHRPRADRTERAFYLQAATAGRRSKRGLEPAIQARCGEDTELTFSAAQVADVRLLGSFPGKAPVVPAWVQGLLGRGSPHS